MDEIAASFDGAWTAFQARDSLRLVGETLEADGRAQYLTFAVRIEDAAARRYLSELAGQLDGIPGVEVYPEPYWHATVKGAGFQVVKRTRDDEVLREELPGIATAARDALAGEPAFDAQLGRVNGFAEVVFVEVEDGGRFRELNQCLTAAIPGLTRYPADGDRFLAHISIARFTSDDGLPRLKARLEELRRRGPGPLLPVRRIEFQKVWLTEEFPEFQAVATYVLAAPGKHTS